MAAMSLTKNTLFNLSKALSTQTPSSLFSPASGKVSRICFTSATNRPVKLYCVQGQHGAFGDHLKGDNKREVREHVDMADNNDKTKEGMEKAKEKTMEMKDKAAEKTEDLKEKAKHRTDEMKEKADDMASKAADKAGDAKDKTKETAYDAKEKTKDAAGTMADKTKETAEAVADKTKETVKGAWDFARDTSQKIKETVVGSTVEKDPIDEFMEDHVHLSDKESDSWNKKAGGGGVGERSTWRPTGEGGGKK